MAGFYPVMLSLNQKKCVVVGGGTVAARKVRGLLEGGADSVVVVSPQSCGELERLASEGSIRLVRREYKEEDAEGAFLLVAAADDPAVNRMAVRTAEKAGALVNAADAFESGGFVTPAVVRRGDLVIAVTTAGASPALAGLIAGELGERYGEDYARRLDKLRSLRDRLAAETADGTLKRVVLRMAAAEMLHDRRGETQAGTADRRNEPIEQWMLRLLAAAGGGQL